MVRDAFFIYKVSFSATIIVCCVTHFSVLNSTEHY
jgi:hypothetical protein